MSDYYSYLLAMPECDVPTTAEGLAKTDYAPLLTKDYGKHLVSAVKKLRAIRERIRPSLMQECESAKKYRDDDGYREVFDDAVRLQAASAHPLPIGPLMPPEWRLLEEIRLNADSTVFKGASLAAYWPDAVEHRALHEPGITEIISVGKVPLDVMTFSSHGDPYKTEIDAVAKTTHLFLDQVLDRLCEINALCVASDSSRDADLGFGRVRTWIPVTPDAKFFIGRVVYKDNELSWTVRFFESVGERLENHCDVLLKLLDDDLRLIVDEATFSVRWLGRKCTLGNSQQFRLIKLLDANHNRFVRFDGLAHDMGGDDDNAIHHVKSRLVKELVNSAMSELAECIKTQPGHYGLFMP